MGKHAVTAPYREHLQAHGYTYKSTRHTERSRRRGHEGRMEEIYTVTLTWPGGRVTRHDADSLELAYRAACAATPAGLPLPASRASEMPSLLSATDQGHSL